jgi:MFS family permease
VSTTRVPLRADLAAFARLTGWGYFPIAFVGRLPFAMMIVGILGLIATTRASVAEGGLAAACAGIGTAALGPLAGTLADKHGQRVVLLVTTAISSAATLGLLWLVAEAAPVAGLGAVAFVLGGTTPQVAPFSRSRLAVLAATPRSVRTRARAGSIVMSYESVVDEASFVVGPVLVGLLTTLIAPWAPLVVGAVIAATVVVAFAVHPTATSVLRGRMPTAPAPVFSSKVVLLATGMLLVGGIFGSILTALTGFMAARGFGQHTGIVYGAMSAGAILVAITMAALPSRFGLASRWVVFAVVALVGAGTLAGSSGLQLALVGLFISGAGVGAALVALFSMGALAAPEGRSTTVLTTLQSTLVVGQALATAACGTLVQYAGATAGYLVTVALALSLVLLAVVVRATRALRE